MGRADTLVALCAVALVAGACGATNDDGAPGAGAGGSGGSRDGQFDNSSGAGGILTGDAGVVCRDGGSGEGEFVYEACRRTGEDAPVTGTDAAVPVDGGVTSTPTQSTVCEPGKVVCGAQCVARDVPCESICGGMRYTCMLRDAEVWCWGENTTGAVGASTDVTLPVPTPTKVLDDATRVDCGWTHACAISGGTTYCWGYNEFHQVDTSADPFVLAPRAVRDDAIDVSAGGYFTCFTFVDGTIECVGQNSSGQHGDGVLNYTSNAPPSGPPASLASGVDKLVLGQHHACALIDRRVLCWGENERGELGRGFTGMTLTVNPPDWVPGFDEVDDLASSGMTNCLLTHGEVWCWGSNRHYELGTSADRPCPPLDCASGTPRKIEGIGTATRIEVAFHHICARNTDAQWWCWGRGYEGQLGDGRTLMPYDSTSDADDAPHDGDEVPVQIAGGHDFRLFGTGVVHGCGTEGTNLYCWGGSRGETTFPTLTSAPTMVAPF